MAPLLFIFNQGRPLPQLLLISLLLFTAKLPESCCTACSRPIIFLSPLVPSMETPVSGRPAPQAPGLLPGSLRGPDVPTSLLPLTSSQAWKAQDQALHALPVPQWYRPWTVNAGSAWPHNLPPTPSSPKNPTLFHISAKSPPGCHL